MTAPRLTQLAHEQVAALLRDGDVAVDATAGNGHDTLFLAGRVGPCGHVYSIDLQAAAVAATERRLRDAGAGLAERVTVVQGCHTRLREWLPAAVHGRVAAVMFNLGYLPGGAREVRTRAPTTAQAVDVALAILRPGGVLTALAYTGHEGGGDEAAALAARVARGPQPHVAWDEIRPSATPDRAPRLFVAHRLG